MQTRRSLRAGIVHAPRFRRPDDFRGIPDVEGMTWFVVKTNPQCEGRAETSIRQAGYETYAPVFCRMLFNPRSKKRLRRLTPFLTGYVFVLLPAHAPPFGFVRLCDGVNDFVKFGGDPLSVTNRDVEDLRRLESNAWLEQDGAFRRRGRGFRGHGQKRLGERVVITTGPFEGFLAAIVEGETKGFAKLITQVFGKFEEVTLPVDDMLHAA